MNTRTKITLLIGGLALAATAAVADQPSGRACANAARQAVLSCREQCTETFRDAKFECKDVEPACGRTCLGTRETCVETALQPLVDCLGGCRDALATAKNDCQTQCGEDSACLDACIDQAQVTAFTCRDTCKETFETGGGEAAVDQCRDDFKACVRACPGPGSAE